MAKGGKLHFFRRRIERGGDTELLSRSWLGRGHDWGNAEMLKCGNSEIASVLSLVVRLSSFGNYGDENGKKFVEFLAGGGELREGKVTVFLQEFDPKLRLIGFLEETPYFRTKLSIGAGSRSFTSVGRY